MDNILSEQGRMQAGQVGGTAEIDTPSNVAEPYNPGTSVFDYQPRNTTEAGFQLRTEQNANQQLYTDRLRIQRQIDRLADSAITPEDFTRLQAMKDQLASMGGSTMELPETAQLGVAELNYSNSIMDDRKIAATSTAARASRVAAETIKQLEQSLATAGDISRPIIERRLADEKANLEAADAELANVTEAFDISGQPAPAIPSTETNVPPAEKTGFSFGENFPSVLNPRLTTDELSFGDNLPSIASDPTSIASDPTFVANELGYNTGTKVGAASKSVPTKQTSGGTSGAGFGSLDSRIATMLSERQKQSESDKWMALAQTGMALMASRNPTLGGALGEAGLMGVGALQKSKKDKQSFETDMLKLQTQRDIAQQRARSSGLKGGSLTLNQMLTNGLNLLKEGNDMLANAQGNADVAGKAQALIEQGQKLIGIAGGGGTGSGAGEFNLSSAKVG